MVVGTGVQEMPLTECAIEGPPALSPTATKLTVLVEAAASINIAKTNRNIFCCRQNLFSSKLFGVTF